MKTKSKRKKKQVPYTGPMKPLPKPDTGCNNGQLYLLFDDADKQNK